MKKKKFMLLAVMLALVAAAAAGCVTGKTTYKVVFNLNYPGTSPIVKTVEKDGTVEIEPPHPPAENLTFEGWFYDVDGKGEEFLPDRVKITKDLTVYAKWKSEETAAFKATVYLNYGDGKPETPAVYTAGADGELTIPAPDFRDGFEFLGWYYNAAGTGNTYDGENLTADVTLYAKWTPTEISDEPITYTLNDGGYYVASKGKTAGGALTIPDTYDGKPVAEIARNGFRDCGLTSLKLGSNIRRIGAAAFKGNDFTELTLPDTVKEIGLGAFGGCDKLTSVTLPFAGQNFDDTGASFFAYIFGAEIYGDSAQFTPAGLTDVTVTNALGVNSFAFYELDSIEKLVVLKADYIADMAFQGLSKLTELTLPFLGNDADSETTILKLFRQTGSLPSLKVLEILGGNVIGAGSLTGLGGLTDLSLPFLGTSAGAAGKEALLGYLFGVKDYAGAQAADQSPVPQLNSDGLVTYYVPASLNSVTLKSGDIGVGAFMNTPVSEVNLPANAYSLGYKAFFNCPNLKKMTLPAGVEELGPSLFFNCLGLEEVEIKGPVKELKTWTFGGCTALKKVNIPSTVTAINGAFFCCYGLEDVVLPEGLRSIAGTAFVLCKALTSINIPASVETIDKAVFDLCENLSAFDVDPGNLYFSDYNGILMDKSGLSILKMPEGITGNVALPETITALPDNAFSGCAKLTRVVLHDRVVSLGRNAFKDCTGLVEAVLPGGIETVGETPFSGAGNSDCVVVLNEGFKDIPTGMFNGYTGSVKLPRSLTSIQGGAFENSASSIIFAENGQLKELSDNAFVNWLGTSITLPEGLEILGSRVFFNALPLAEIVLPSTLLSIGSQAFYNTAWYNAKPDGMLIINNVVYGVKGNQLELREANLQEGIVGIAGEAFRNCAELVTVTLPSTLKYIGDYAFFNCASISEITIPKSIEHILSNAFNGVFCPVAFEEGAVIETLDEGAFAFYCGDEIVIPARVTSVGRYAFQYFKGDIVFENEGRQLDEIGDYAFAQYMGSSLTIPENVIKIGSYAYAWCVNIAQFDMRSEKLEILGIGSFYASSGVDHITLPASVCEIGEGSFKVDNRLNSITLLSPTAPVILPDLNDTEQSVSSGLEGAIVSGHDKSYPSHNTHNVIFYVPEGALDSYKTATYWSDYYLPYLYISMDDDFVIDNGTLIRYTGSSPVVRVPDNVTAIGDKAFYFARGLSQITLPAKVASIGTDAFNDCTNLTTIIFEGETPPAVADQLKLNYTWFIVPDTAVETYRNAEYLTPYAQDIVGAGEVENGLLIKDNRLVKVKGDVSELELPTSVTSIAPRAAINNIRLRSVAMTDNVVSLGEEAFSGCINLGTVTLSDNLKVLAKKVFFGCESLTSAALPAQTTTVGIQAFAGCSSLAEVIFNDKLTAIENSGFQGTAAAAFALPASLTTLGNSVFAQNVHLKEMTLSDNVTSIGTALFNSCKTLKSVTLGKNITELPQSTFDTCDSLTSVITLGRVTVIDRYAFASCYSLTDYEVPDSVVAIGDFAFRYSNSLARITIPASCASLGKNAFEGCYKLRGVTILGGSVGEYAFKNCRELTSADLSGAVSIGQYAFGDVTTLTEVKFGQNLKNIGIGAFMSTGIKALSLPAGLTSIGASAFSDTDIAGTLEIPATVSTVDGYAFYNCTGIDKLILHRGLTTIGNYCFRALGIFEVTIPLTVTKMGTEVFVACDRLNTVYVEAAEDAVNIGAPDGWSAAWLGTDTATVLWDSINL